MTFFIHARDTVLFNKRRRRGLKITKDEVEYVAHLARLDFSEEEKVEIHLTAQ